MVSIKFEVVLLAWLSISAISVWAHPLYNRKEVSDEYAQHFCKKHSKLESISQLDALVNQLDKDSGCDERTREALVGLHTLVSETKSDQCSIESVSKFKQYYNTYLDTSNAELKAINEKLPQRLRDFALLYGVKLSELCRVNMVKVLLNDAKHALQNADSSEFSDFIASNGPIAQIFGCWRNSDNPDEMILPVDVEKATKRENDVTPSVMLKIKAVPIMKRSKEFCERLKPIYGKVMIPVATLANLGFVQRSKELKELIRNASENDRDSIGKWARILFLCGGVRNLYLDETEETKKKAVGNDATIVQVYNSEEEVKAAKVKGTNLISESSDDNQLSSNEQQEFKPKLGVEMPDSIAGFFKRMLLPAHVNTNKDEITRIRDLLVAKSYQKILFMVSSLVPGANTAMRTMINRLQEEQVLLKRAIAAQQNFGNLGVGLVEMFNREVSPEISEELAVADDIGCNNIECSDCCEACCKICCCCCLGECVGAVCSGLGECVGAACSGMGDCLGCMCSAAGSCLTCDFTGDGCCSACGGSSAPGNTVIIMTSNQHLINGRNGKPTTRTNHDMIMTDGTLAGTTCCFWSTGSSGTSTGTSCCGRSSNSGGGRVCTRVDSEVTRRRRKVRRMVIVAIILAVLFAIVVGSAVGGMSG